MIIYLFSVIYVAITLLPLIKHDGWWLRIFEFPRSQITILGIFIIIFGSLLLDKNIYFYLSHLAVLLCVIYQVKKVIPYTSIYPKQMLSETNTSDKDVVRLMVVNVFMNNRKYQELVELINIHKPDIVLAVEVDSAWHQYLNENINFTNVIAKPLDNTYGMALYSNYELYNETIEYLVEDDVPSIHVKVKLPSGRDIFLHCLHPKPPAPQESTQTTERDGELLLVGKRVKENGVAAIVAGDLNDVAWSYTTTLFQKISHLLDPRIGRGMYSTFHVKFPFLRFPLDHAFASTHFKLKSLKRLPSVGSDHFPMLMEFVIGVNSPEDHEPMTANQSDRQVAESKINEANS